MATVGGADSSKFWEGRISGARRHLQGEKGLAVVDLGCHVSITSAESYRTNRMIGRVKDMKT